MVNMNFTKTIAFFIALIALFSLCYAYDDDKGAIFCKRVKSCEKSEYTDRYTKNCKEFEDILLRWKLANNKYGDLLFCYGYSREKEPDNCSVVDRTDTDENDEGEEITIVKGPRRDVVLGAEYLNIVTHNEYIIRHSGCTYLENDVSNKGKNKEKGRGL